MYKPPPYISPPLYKPIKNCLRKYTSPGLIVGGLRYLISTIISLFALAIVYCEPAFPLHPQHSFRAKEPITINCSTASTRATVRAAQAWAWGRGWTYKYLSLFLSSIKSESPARFIIHILLVVRECSSLPGLINFLAHFAPFVHKSTYDSDVSLKSSQKLGKSGNMKNQGTLLMSLIQIYVAHVLYINSHTLSSIHN
jgi:hypothetical protein